MSVNLDRIWCVIPVYNHGATVAEVVRKSRAVLKNVLVVDDGSEDADVAQLFSGMDVAVLKHTTNLGKGEAIRTAARYVEERGGEYIITLDADGQHDPEDIKKFLPLIAEDQTSLIVGCRDFNTANIPPKSRFGRRFANFWLRVETGVYVDDCQSGFRAYPVKYLNKLKMSGSRYDFEAEVLARAAWAGLELKTVPISVYYPEPGRRVSHFRPFMDNLRISHTHARLIGRCLLPWGHKKLVERKRDAGQGIWRHPVVFLKRLLGEHATPEGLAMSAAVGVFLGTLPLLFVHTAIIIYVSVRLNLNKIMAVNIQHLCMPPFIPALCIQIGHYLRYGRWLTELSSEAVFSQFYSRLVEWFIGSLIMAPIGAVFIGTVVFYITTSLQKRASLSSPRPPNFSGGSNR